MGFFGQMSVQARRTAPRVTPTAMLALAALLGVSGAAAAADSFLATLHRHTVLASMVPANGDQNPYAVVVVPASSGKLRRDDVLVDNFNDSGNLQGLGTTILAMDPASHAVTTFAALPRHLPGCPGGVGLTTAMAVLRRGYVVVGSLPSSDGTTATKGQGCLIVLDNQGAVAATLAGADIDGPWGNMAVQDDGDRATLFVSMAGFGVGAPGQAVVRRATVLRLRLDLPAAGAPAVVSRTVIADGLAEQADKSVFVIGPTGLALAPDGTLYVSDAIENRVVAIPDAATRAGSAGTGRPVSADGLLHRPLALTLAPNGNLLAVNGLDGEVVEIDPASGRQPAAQWVDPDRAQTPPGSGDLFGIALTPDRRGFYYVEDENNMLLLAH